MLPKCLAMFLLPWCAFAATVEIASLNEVDKFLAPSDLLILDIDNTLIVTAQSLGSDTWFYHRLDALGGINSREALSKALKDWESVQALTAVTTTEPRTAELVSQWQRNVNSTMGLTTRGLALANITIDQLRSVDIDLSKTAPSKEELFYKNPHGISLRDGILFTAGTHKGVALEKLLADLSFRPVRIVFINDRASHLNQLGDHMQQLGYDFLGLRYAGCDAMVEAFDAEITDLQWEHFGKIMSDAEAQAILSESRN